MSELVPPYVSVILPAFNEAAHIFDVSIATMRELDRLGLDFELIVVDDGSADRTGSEAQRLLEHARGDNVRIIRYDVNQGKGNAVMTGAKHARAALVVFLDSDGDLHPRQLEQFFAILETTGADVVIGSKMHPASQVDYPWHRRLCSIGYYIVVRALFGLPVRDTQTGMKLFRRPVLVRAAPYLSIKGYAFDVELLAYAHRFGYRIAEAPVELRPARRFGRIRWSDMARIIADTATIYYRFNVAGAGRAEKEEVGLEVA